MTWLGCSIRSRVPAVAMKGLGGAGRRRKWKRTSISFHGRLLLLSTVPIKRPLYY